METIKAIKERRSIRIFKDEKVDPSVMTEILSAANHSPTWNHFQINRYNVIEDKNLIEKIADEAMFGFNHNMNILRNAAGLIIVSVETGKSGRFPGIQKSPEQWEMFDAGCATQTLSLAAHAKGVGSVILGVFDQEKLAEIINLPSNEVVATVVPYGYEIEHPNAPKRKTLDEVVRYI